MERPEFDRLITATLPQIQQAAQKYAMLYRRFYEWEDIAQTALLKMIRFADMYDPAKGDLLPWACVIICNTIKTHVARSMTMPDMEEVNALIIERTPAHADKSPEEQLQAAFILDNINRETCLFIEGYNYAEIAARRGFRSKVTAKNRIDKCAVSLCRALGMTVKQQRRQRMYSIAPG